ncbi:DnaA regulatory inactivator Hda [Cellvibrio japonicus]|nr:DnaA regulatory inactivator Hda [Cellvibrio japonicus]QEI17712.1 DnaA regulatory inactivator Hda [Cellvibrio japonicus]QEI21287.1 DnaA regulatory inactivator Hda [Cellvibrio japonicus]
MTYAPRQLSLGVSLNDDATFDNFYAPASQHHNALVVDGLRRQVEGKAEAFVYLWGAPGAGLTHLLQASCHYAQTLGQSIQYLPLRDMAGYAPAELFVGLEALDLVCLDCLTSIAGRGDWELAIFNLYNALRDGGKKLLVAAEQSPRELPLQLEDLRSRLQWGVTYQVHSLSDEDKQQALQKRARARGLELNDEVAQFIIQRLPRDTNELFCQLQRLDQASLAEQRKLTIPFVKKVLSL